MDPVESSRPALGNSYFNQLSNVLCGYAPVFCKFFVPFYKVWLNVFSDLRERIWEDPFYYEQDPFRAYCIEVGGYTLCFLWTYCHYYGALRIEPRRPMGLKSLCVLVIAIAQLVYEGRAEYFASENLLRPIVIAITNWGYVAMSVLIPWVVVAANWIYLVLEDQVMSDPLVINTIEWVSSVFEGVDLDQLLHKAVNIVVLIWIFTRRNWQERQDCCKVILILLLGDRVMRLCIKVTAQATENYTIQIYQRYPSISQHKLSESRQFDDVSLNDQADSTLLNERADIQSSSNRQSCSAAEGHVYNYMSGILGTGWFERPCSEEIHIASD